MEIVPPVRSWCEPFFSDIRHWNEMPRGGHFAAFEQPELFVEDVRAFFRELRSGGGGDSALTACRVVDDRRNQSLDTHGFRPPPE